jgi:2-amino-4-hydroxy-6-hydroxymethyldihydropteridine diphosphokinase
LRQWFSRIIGYSACVGPNQSPALGSWVLQVWFAFEFAISFRRHYRKWLHLRRATLGQCVGCGYDLRSSVERCPECGSEIKKLEESSIPATFREKLDILKSVATTFFAEDMAARSPTSLPKFAYVALGSNLGNRERNLQDATARLAATPGVRVRRMSSFFENPAVGGPAGSPPFLNAVVEIETTLPAEQLLSRLLEIERELGRTRTEKWGPRIIDLDLIFYGQQVTRTEGLTVPHPRMHERRFVLQPLAELAPDLMHPILNKTVGELLQSLES